MPEMIFDITKTEENSKGAWVKSVDVECKIVHKRWIEPFDDKKIKCGSVGVFKPLYEEQNSRSYEDPEFEEQADYWDTGYDIGRIHTVEKEEIRYGDLKRVSFEYEYYAAKGGSWKFRIENALYDVARPDNLVLLDNGNFVANLTTQGNVCDFIHDFNMRNIYNLIPIRDEHKRIDHYNFARYPYECAGVPAIVYGKSTQKPDFFYVFMPQYPQLPEIQILQDGLLQPSPRASDVILLDPTDVNGVFALKENLTANLQNCKMNRNFRLQQHRDKIEQRCREAAGVGCNIK